MSPKLNLKKYFAIAISLFLLCSLVLLNFSQQALAGPPVRAVKRAPAIHQKKFVDSRYQHNRSYPVRGQFLRSLPRDHRVVIHGDSRYYSSHGVWYRPYHGRFVVVAPPIGLFVPFLPLSYATIWVGGMPYYYANEIYYTQTPGGYVIVEPPQGEISAEPPDTDDETEDITEDKMFIYPRKGQSQQQQDNDRYECHEWASKQANYDPTKISPDVSFDDMMQKRADYRQAMSTCLDSRGYSVK